MRLETIKLPPIRFVQADRMSVCEKRRMGGHTWYKLSYKQQPRTKLFTGKRKHRWVVS